MPPLPIPVLTAGVSVGFALCIKAFGFSMKRIFMSLMVLGATSVVAPPCDTQVLSDGNTTFSPVIY